MDADGVVRETEEERVRRELAVLFGPEEEVSDSGDSEECEWPAVTDLEPEDLYSYLEGEGLLRLSVTVPSCIPIDARSADCDYRILGEWKSKQVRLVRDLTSTTRVKYLTEVTPIEAETGEEVFVSRIWTGEQLPALVGFGSLLEWNDGVYRAGIEVDRQGFRSVEVPWARQDEVEWIRTSEDDSRNRRADHFLQMLAVCHLTLLNGVSKFPDSNGYTCYTPNGNSVDERGEGQMDGNSPSITAVPTL
ncbi:hypothetical protein R1sor_007351 [Riccia sorocarpa]|uniref:Uncharacterized protein n=1 Tax=Riccia sorocarpa TaxID=122646 RepID=A0ABD3HTU3_9MARC